MIICLKVPLKNRIGVLIQMWALYRDVYTAYKVSKYGVFSGPYFYAFELKRENTDLKKPRTWTYFAQC